ncbi:MAG: glycosyltransferase [Planctomycetes bacterium]|nr:glycosyltransferase [Planctomycetota bacterium]
MVGARIGIPGGEVAEQARAGFFLPEPGLALGSGPTVRILLVSHAYPPHSTAGTETYTAGLAEKLTARGHTVEVFTTVKDIGRPQFALERRTHRGVPVHELVNNLHYATFRATWDDPDAELPFQRVLDAFRPDVVHVQHLLYLSSGILARARRATPVAFTLHDYWLQCPRFGHRVHADGAVCHVIDTDRCGTCIARFKYAQSGLERRVGNLIARVHGATGVDLGPLARGARDAAARARRRGGPGRDGSAGTEPDPAVDPERAAGLAAEARLRLDELRARAVAHVDLFLATSRFLLDRMVRETGLSADRIEHLPLGVDLAAFDVAARVPRSGPLRVAFLGTRTPLKGAHVLLEAWLALPEPTRARARLVLAGPDHHEPEYQARLAVLARRAGAELLGRRSRVEVAQLLAATDLIVVPSLWYENSPLVILEALAARVPLLVSDQGGMAELVTPGETGFHFRQGDVADLARELARAIDEPERLVGLFARPARPLGVDEHVARVEARYAELIARRERRA